MTLAITNSYVRQKGKFSVNGMFKNPEVKI